MSVSTQAAGTKTPAKGPAAAPAPRKKRAPLSEEYLKNETPEERFSRLGTPRVRKAKKALEQIGNLASSRYKYTPAQIAKMAETLQKALDQAVAQFEPGGSDAEEAPFTF